MWAAKEPLQVAIPSISKSSSRRKRLGSGLFSNHLFGVIEVDALHNVIRPGPVQASSVLAAPRDVRSGSGIYVRFRFDRSSHLRRARSCSFFGCVRLRRDSPPGGRRVAIPCPSRSWHAQPSRRAEIVVAVGHVVPATEHCTLRQRAWSEHTRLGATTIVKIDAMCSAFLYTTLSAWMRIRPRNGLRAT